MIRAQGSAYWSRRPSLCDRLIASTLHTLAMLAFTVARLFAPRCSNPTAECDGSPAPTFEANGVLDPTRRTTPLLLPTTTTRKQERNNRRKGAAAPSARSRALMVSSDAWRSHASRPVYPELVEGSNHEGDTHNSLNASFSGKRSASRESRFEKRGNARHSHRHANRDSRDRPENDAQLGLWPKSAQQQQQQQSPLQLPNLVTRSREKKTIRVST
jgi:hypothetical protein